MNASLSLGELARQIRTQFTPTERAELARLIQHPELEEPTNEQILHDLKEDYVALQKGTLKTRPADDFLNELRDEGFLK